jgi:hypothetical protein
MEALGPWVQDCIRLMDSDGAYAHFKYDGQLADQPALCMDILDTVRSKWCELRNREMESKYGKQAGGNN